MKACKIVLAGVLAGLGVAAVLRAAQPAPQHRPRESLIRAKVDAARKTYRVMWENNREALVPFAELAYRWSRRWLEAGLELSDKKADQAAAYQAHLDRMHQLARITRGRYKNRVNTVDEVTATDYYNAEAEIWLEEAKSR
jgi:hypothetical protein